MLEIRISPCNVFFLENVTAYDGSRQLEDSAILVDYSEILEKGYGKCHIKYRAKDSEGNQSEVVVLSPFWFAGLALVSSIFLSSVVIAV